jgi:hypothetical protein
MGEGECKVFILHDVLNGGRRKESVAGNGDHLGGGLESVGISCSPASEGTPLHAASCICACGVGTGKEQCSGGVEWSGDHGGESKIHALASQC